MAAAETGHETQRGVDEGCVARVADQARDGRSILLTGDAHADILETSIATLLSTRGQTTLAVDAFKLPHHASRYNLSPGLVDLVDTKRYLVSTDGSSRSRHPDPVAISRIITKRPDARLEFNYSSPTTTTRSSAAIASPSAAAANA